MIPVLDELKPEEATEVLTRAASLVLPNPQGHKIDVQGLDERAVVLIESLKDHVGKVHSEGDMDAEVFRLLTERLTRPYLTEQTKPAIIARLSDKRVLPRKFYQLVFHPAFKATGSLIQVRPAHVEDAIRSADAVQLLSPAEGFGEEDIFFPMSLFVKYHRDGNRGDFALLVQCFHEAGKLMIFNAWKIFPADIEHVNDSSPLALFKAFLRRFGVKISFADRAPSELIINDVFPNENEGFALCKIERKPGMHAAHFARIKFSRLGTIAVTIALSVNLDLYLASLVNRGVPVDTTNIGLFSIDDSQPVIPLVSG